MIITKTPLRISFFGGGSDIPEFYEKHGEGICISTTIDSYMYVAVNRCTASHTRVIYSELEVADHATKIKHDRVREVLKHFGIENNIEICSFSDIPTKGTGLGSSSTFTVGLINAVCPYELERWSIADLACDIEIDRCKEPIGKQDQYAAAYGGMNQYTFTKDTVYVDPIQISRTTSNELNRRLMFFNTGKARAASSVLGEQLELLKTQTNVSDTQTLVDVARQAKKCLEANDLDRFGKLFHDAWEVKKKLSSTVSNEEIDTMYTKAMTSGAYGGKILGAGNGGYLMLFVPPHNQSKVRDALFQYEERKFKFSHTGSQRTKIS